MESLAKIPILDMGTTDEHFGTQIKPDSSLGF
jgi:hypothetical protein